MSYHSTPTRPNSRAGSRYKDGALLMARAGVAHFAYIPDDLPVREGQRVRWLNWQTQAYQTGTVKPGASTIGGVCRVSVHIDGSPANATNMVNVEQLEVVASKVIPINTLSIEEQHALQQYEHNIESGIKAVYEMGKALRAIRDQRLYRAEYPSFEDYLQCRWELKQSRAYQIMAAAGVIENLKLPQIVELPANEAQARPLVPLEPSEQQIVWQVVTETAPDGKVTAGHVKSVVTVAKDILTTGAIDDGTGNDIPIQQATVQHLKAAVTEETYERMKRQQEHIKSKSTPRTYHLKNEQYTVSAKGVVMLTDLPAGATVNVSVWSEN